MRLEGKERKRIKKLASAVPISEIEAYLAPEEDIPAGHFLVGNADDGYVICCWQTTNGLMMLTIDDDVLAEACEQHLLNNGLVFASRTEVDEYAEANNWPKPSRR